MINRAFANRPPGLHLAMHLCRGNNQSGWFGEGGYDPIADVLFNKINVDSYFLEYETERAGGFEPLRLVPKNKTVVLGLVSSKLPQLESKDLLKRRIDEAAKYIGLDQLCLSPQCGFASSTEGNRLTEDEQFAKLRLVVEVADEVWGRGTGHSHQARQRKYLETVARRVDAILSRSVIPVGHGRGLLPDTQPIAYKRQSVESEQVSGRATECPDKSMVKVVIRSIPVQRI